MQARCQIGENYTMPKNDSDSSKPEPIETIKYDFGSYSISSHDSSPDQAELG